MRNGDYMTKPEFLEILQTALSGRVSAGVLTENLRFYEDYINTEIRKGKSEEEVFAALGDPRLIARTIIETKGSRVEGTEDREEKRRSGRIRFGRGNVLYKVPLWAWMILVLLVVVLVLSAIFSVLSAILPVLLPILGVLLLIKIFRDWFH